MAHTVTIGEEDRQAILLALFKLKHDRPGWTDYIQDIEANLGGQLAFPGHSALPERWRAVALTALAQTPDSLVGINPEVLHEMTLALLEDLATTRHALEKSVKLQSHYAKLLNMHDGGERKEFTVETWLARLAEMEQKEDGKDKRER